MRHIILSVTLLIASLVFCLMAAFTVRRACTETNDLLQQAYTAAQDEDFSASDDYLSRASSLWGQRERFFGIVLRHDEADEVLRGFASLASYAETEDTDEFLATCASVMATIEHISGMTRATFHNILSAPPRARAPWGA